MVKKKSAHKSAHKFVNKKHRNVSLNKDIPTGNQEDVILETYEFQSERIPVSVTIIKKSGEFVPTYALQVSVISKTTEMILEKVRLELIRRVSLGAEDIGDVKKTDLVEDKFNELIDVLINKYFPDSEDETVTFLRSYLKMNSLGLGALELLMNDESLEELVINQASEPAWVYHKKHGWLKTNVYLKSEDQTRHYASIIGRRVGRQISVLSPLLDAHLGTGDRVNATLSPVSTNGNTITIRKFSKDPWTITKFLKTRTISPDAAALIWTAIQYELSALIAGGTASGKTSALNVFANFFPPNQRILSIEDTREIVLPKFLHWVPLNTTLPNAEGKGEINMGDLLVNSLRMRPDRILVGEVRRKRETETLFEAIHTGHSVYATFHANSAKETVERLTNAPLDVPKIMLPAISLIIVQFRNRRSGKRRTFQVAEIMANGEANVIMQYDIKTDLLVKIGKSKALYENIELFTGMTDSEITKELNDKVKVLNYLVKKNIDDVDGVGRIVAEYYTNKVNLMHYVNTDKDFPLASQLKIELPLVHTVAVDADKAQAQEESFNSGDSKTSGTSEEKNILPSMISNLRPEALAQEISNKGASKDALKKDTLNSKKDVSKETSKQDFKETSKEASRIAAETKKLVNINKNTHSKSDTHSKGVSNISKEKFIQEHPLPDLEEVASDKGSSKKEKDKSKSEQVSKSSKTSTKKSKFSFFKGFGRGK